MSKIIVDRVELRNFFSYGNQWTSLDFHSGINVILGHDAKKDRSNGSGKTSILQSIPFALFGQTSKGVSLNKIVNWKNGKNCEVRLTFTKDGIPYVLHRGIKPGILELYKDGVAVPKLSDKRMFQKELEEDLIGMDYRTSEILLFQNANNMISLFNTPKEEKRRFIEKLFNLEIYSKMNEHVNRKLAAVVTKIGEIEHETIWKRKRISELEHEISNLGMPNIESYQKDVDLIVRDLASLEEKLDDFDIDTLVKNREELTNEINHLNDQIKMISDYIKSLFVEKSTLESDVKNFTSYIERQGNIQEQREKLNLLQEGIKKLSGLEDELKEAKTQKEDIRVKISELTSERKGYETAIASTKKKIDEWERVKNKDVDVQCPTCFQMTDKGHILSHIDGEISRLTAEMKENISEYSVVTVEYDEYQKKLTQVTDSIKVLEDRVDKKKQIEAKISSMSGLDEKERMVVEYQGKIEEIGIRLSDVIPKIQEQSRILAKCEEDKTERDNFYKKTVELINMYQIHKTRVDSKKRELDTAKTTLDKMKDVADKAEAEYQIKVMSKKNLEDEVDVFSGNEKKLNTMKDYLEYIKISLKDENVKQYAISNIVPFLQQQTNHYLSETNGHYYVELNNWLEGTIKGHGVGECDFGNMSGGEGRTIDLALKFAMMDVSRRQAGSYLDILVLDELLDSSIDSHGLEKLMDIVKLKQREDNLKVFIVSHREEISDFGVDRLYRVVKEDGFSRLEV